MLDWIRALRFLTWLIPVAQFELAPRDALSAPDVPSKYQANSSVSTWIWRGAGAAHSPALGRTASRNRELSEAQLLETDQTLQLDAVEGS